jgi:hypothetical protein
MLDRVKKLAPFVLLGCIVLFYANEIWRSSKSPHPPERRTRTEHTYYEAKHDNILSDAWNWTTQDPVSFYTFILAIFTGVLGVTAFVQIRYLRKADETARIAADAAKKSADAGKISADHIPLVERAYIFGGPSKINTENDITSLKISVDNSGRTPGIIKYICAEFGLELPSGSVPSYPNGKRILIDVAVNSSAGLNPMDPANKILIPSIYRTNVKHPHYFWGYIVSLR